MSSRTTHSENVPGVLTAALSKLRTESKRTAATKATPIALVKRTANRLPFRIAMSRRKLIARGAGIYEEASNGDIWYREGEFLVRQAIDTNSIVEDYLNTCRSS